MSSFNDMANFTILFIAVRWLRSNTKNTALEKHCKKMQVIIGGLVIRVNANGSFLDIFVFFFEIVCTT